MISRKILIGTVIVGLLFALALAQNRSQKRESDVSVRIDHNKPTVFLEFVKLGVRKQPRGLLPGSEVVAVESSNIETVWLRVRNNSRWAIKFRAHEDSLAAGGAELTDLPNQGTAFVPVKEAELELSYGVEPVNAEVPIKANLPRKLPYTRLYSSVSDVWLLPGTSTTFVVEREELRRNLQVFLPFKYAWEVSVKNRGYGEPEHRVYFTWDKFENAAGL